MILALMTAPRSSALLTASSFPIAGINVGACIMLALGCLTCYGQLTGADASTTA